MKLKDFFMEAGVMHRRGDFEGREPETSFTITVMAHDLDIRKLEIRCKQRGVRLRHAETPGSIHLTMFGEPRLIRLILDAFGMIEDYGTWDPDVPPIDPHTLAGMKDRES